jgi:integrase
MASIQKLPSGKYRAQVRRADVYKARTFACKADAAAWAAQIEQAVERGTGVGKIAPQALTVGEVLMAYVDETRASVATRSTARKVARILGDLPIRQLNSFHVQRFVDARLKEVSGATVARDLADLSSCLKWARHARHIDIDDTVAADARRGLRVAKIKTSSRQRSRIFTPEELARLFAEADARARPIPYCDLIELALASALRLGEICGLRWADYDGRTVLVRARKHPDATVKEDNHQRVALTARGNASP